MTAGYYNGYNISDAKISLGVSSGGASLLQDDSYGFIDIRSLNISKFS